MLLTLSFIDWLLIVAYAVALVLLGTHARGRSKGNAADLLLGGRMLTLPGFVAGLVSTWYGGILGVGEFTWLYGISNWLIFGVPYYVFALVFAFWFAKRVRESEVLSIPDMLMRRYGRATAGLGALLVYAISSPAPYILMQGVLIQVVTGWDLLPALLVGAVLTGILMALGGFSSVVNMDLLQFLLMFLGFAVLLTFLLVGQGISVLFSPALPENHLRLFGGHGVQYVFVWFLIASWTIVAPPFHQFTLSARDGTTAKWGILLSVLCWMVFDAMTTLCGLYAKVLLPNLSVPTMAFPLLGEAVLPVFFKGLFFLGMFATILSTTTGFTFISAATLGHDVLAPLLGLRDDQGIRRATRGALGVTMIVGMIAALVIPSIINLWYVIGTVFIPGILLPLLTAYYPRLAVSARATLASMVLGFGTAVAWVLAGAMLGSLHAPSYPLGLEPMIPGIFASGLPYCLRKRFVLSVTKEARINNTPDQRKESGR